MYFLPCRKCQWQQNKKHKIKIINVKACIMYHLIQFETRVRHETKTLKKGKSCASSKQIKQWQKFVFNIRL